MILSAVPRSPAASAGRGLHWPEPVFWARCGPRAGRNRELRRYEAHRRHPLGSLLRKAADCRRYHMETRISLAASCLWECILFPISWENDPTSLPKNAVTVVT